MGFFANVIAESRGGISYTTRVKNSFIDLVASHTQPLENIPPQLMTEPHQITEQFSETVPNRSSETSIEELGVQSEIDINGPAPQMIAATTMRQSPNEPRAHLKNRVDENPTPPFISDESVSSNVSVLSVQSGPQQPVTTHQQQSPHEASAQAVESGVEKSSHDIQAFTDNHTVVTETPYVMHKPKLEPINTRGTTHEGDTINHAIETRFLHRIVDTSSMQGSQPHVSNNYQSDRPSAPVESKPTQVQQSNIEPTPGDEFANQAQQNSQQANSVEAAVKRHLSQANIALLHQPSAVEPIRQPQVHIGQLDIIVQAPPVTPVKSQPVVTTSLASRQYLRSL
jgi:hypothetical protein